MPKFDMFGIEFMEDKSFKLYPKNFTSNFMDSKVKLQDEKFTHLSLFSTDKMAESRGFMVKESVCFDNLVRMFSSVKTPIKADANLNNEMKAVSITGFIL